MGSGDTLVLRPNADATSEQPGMVVVCVCRAFGVCVITSAMIIFGPTSGLFLRTVLRAHASV